MKTTMFAAIGGLVLVAVSGAWADEKAGAEPTISVKQLQEDFRKLEFGMFIHYNMATYTGDEWVKGYPDASTFDPGGKVDTDAWADAAVAAGMTYGVLTTKHVGGFCLWDSKHTTYDVMHLPEHNTAPGETCWKLERAWFWKEGTGSGNAQGQLGHMANAHARNSNYLLNVGPDRRGAIIESSVKTLAEIGKLRKPKATQEDTE